MVERRINVVLDDLDRRVEDLPPMRRGDRWRICKQVERLEGVDF
jgi:hypothetical protein